MLPRQSRIDKNAFNELLKNSHFSGSTHLSLRYGKQDGSSAKVAVTVSKKVSKSAVVRNLIRRRIHACLEREIGYLRPGQYQLIAKTGIQNIRGEKLRQEVALLLKPHKRG